jgi:hypothetical protein
MRSTKNIQLNVRKIMAPYKRAIPSPATGVSSIAAKEPSEVYKKVEDGKEEDFEE